MMQTLGPDELDRVEVAIRQAETCTAGEIVVVLSRQAASYRSPVLAAALVAALVAPWPLVWLTDLGTTRILVVQLVVALLVAVVARTAPVRRALVPASIRRRRGREAAERAFASCGLARTRGRTGILLFVALAERHAEVIGDAAIAARINEATWRGLIDELVGDVHRAGLADALVGAVARIGAILAEHVPAERQPLDELPNRVVLL